MHRNNKVLETHLSTPISQTFALIAGDCNTTVREHGHWLAGCCQWLTATSASYYGVVSASSSRPAHRAAASASRASVITALRRALLHRRGTRIVPRASHRSHRSRRRRAAAAAPLDRAASAHIAPRRGPPGRRAQCCSTAVVYQFRSRRPTSRTVTGPVTCCFLSPAGQCRANAAAAGRRTRLACHPQVQQQCWQYDAGVAGQD
jgi:hypothetical protein